MAITKKRITRQCPVTGTITRSCTISFHGKVKIDEKYFVGHIAELVQNLCPDPNGKLSFNVFYKLLMKDFPKQKFDKEELVIIKKYVKNLLNIVLDYFSKKESTEEDVIFLEETTLEERNEIGFKNAIVVE